MLKHISKIFILLLLLTVEWNGYGIDRLLRRKINLQIVNKPIINILQQIEVQAGVTFSYSSDLFNKNELITITIKNKTIAETLDELFQYKTINYKEIGSQIVLFTDKSKLIKKKYLPPPEPLIINTSNKDSLFDTIPNIKETVVNDSIFSVINTVKIYDTIKFYDTIHYIFYDTVKMNEKITLSNFEVGFGIGLHKSKISTNNNLYEYQTQVIKKSISPALAFYLYSMYHIIVNTNRFSFGIKLSSYREKSNYNFYEPYTITTTKIERTWKLKLDTVYYKVNTRISQNTGKDTIWYFIYQRIPIDKETLVSVTDTLKLNSNLINKYAYLSFPIYYGFEKQITQNLSAHIELGPSIDLLFNKSGQILDVNNMQLIKYNQISFTKWNISLHTNMGIKYNLPNNNALTCSIFMERSIQSITSPDLPISIINRGIGLRMGYLF